MWTSLFWYYIILVLPTLLVSRETLSEHFSTIASAFATQGATEIFLRFDLHLARNTATSWWCNEGDFHG
jgi:hypothetical protein